MAEQAAKRRDGDCSPDRISKLPEGIFQHILCFLDRKTSVQTCVLSKPWRHRWCARPKIDFIQGRTVAGDKHSFLSVLDRTLQAYLDQKLTLQKFTVRMFAADDDAASLLNKWIPMLLKNMAVKIFDLSFLSGRFELPSLFFRSESLEDLHLRGCILNSAEVRVCFKRLREIALHRVSVSEQMLDNVLSNSPSVEYVLLSGCTGFARIKLMDNKHPKNLTRFDFSNYERDSVSFEMGSNIQTLRNIQITRCELSVDHNQLHFASLRRLLLTNVRLPSDFFSCSFPCLEELALVYCHFAEEFHLLCCSMKTLHIANSNRPFVATVDAPSLVSFRYEGILPGSISFAATTSEHDWKSYVTLKSFDHISNESSSCFNELTGMLKELGRSEISLALDQSMLHFLRNRIHIENDNIVGVFKAKLPVALQHLTVHESGRNLHSSSAEFLNSVFHIFRPRFLKMDLFTNPKTELHQVAEILLKEREMVQCDFWQRALEGVSVQALYPNESEWQPVQSTSLSEFSSKSVGGTPRVQLEWRE